LFQLAQQQAQAGGGAPGGGGGLPGLGAAGGAGGAAALAGLRNPAQMAQIRQLVEQNPALLQPFIQQLVQGNPQLGQLIAQRPELLGQLLGGGGEGEGDGDEEMPGNVIAITPEEDAAIRRVSASLPSSFNLPMLQQLEALGFDRQQAAEAYFACDKNEDLAANYLFEGGFD
jgi:UV excision repair protein RAD23